MLIDKSFENLHKTGIIIERGPELMPVEIKSGKTVARDFFSALEKWMALSGDLAASPMLIYGGDESCRHKGIAVAGWKGVPEALAGL